MKTEVSKAAVSKFPLRLMPSVRRNAEAFSAKEGVSLNQFINLAVAEKLAHLEYDEWERSRKQPTPALAARALQLLDKATGKVPKPLPRPSRTRRVTVSRTGEAAVTKGRRSSQVRVS